MTTWFIAFRYLTSRFNAFGALLTVAGGTALLIVVLSIMEGFRTDLENRIRGTSSDLKVESRAFLGLRDPESLAARLRQVPGVARAVPYVETIALWQDSRPEWFLLQAADLASLGTDGSVDRFLGEARRRAARSAEEGGAAPDVLDEHDPAVALQPATAAEILSTAWLDDGLWRAAGRKPPEDPSPPILVGWETHRVFGFRIGQTIELVTYSPSSGAAPSGRFTVAGILLSRDYVFDSRTILMPLDRCLEFLKVGATADGGLSVSGIKITTTQDAELETVTAAVSEATKDVPFKRVKSWREEKASLLRAVRIEKAVVGIILGVLILFSSFMIFIALTILVVEKTRDLGILQSLGSTALAVARIFVSIGGVIVSGGVVLGVVLGVGFCLSINTIQRWLYLLVGFELFPRSVYYVDTIPVRIDPWDFVVVIVPMLLFGLAASLFPAWRAARKDPVVSLRYE